MHFLYSQPFNGFKAKPGNGSRVYQPEICPLTNKQKLYPNHTDPAHAIICFIQAALTKVAIFENSISFDKNYEEKQSKLYVRVITREVG